MSHYFTKSSSLGLPVLALIALLVPATLAEGKDSPSEDWLSGAQEQIRAREYHFSWNTDGSLSAPNRGQDLRTSIDEGGFRIVSRTEGAEKFELGLRLTGYGRRGKVLAVDAGWLNADEGRAELRRPELTEWFVNDDRGLEHGFDIEDPPAGRGEVALHMALDGSLLAYPLGVGDRGILLKTAQGKPLLRYDGLTVIDSTGRELPARFEIAVGELRILFDDDEALYPVTVDPIVTSSSWVVTGSLYLGLGSSVSTAGDVNGDGYSDVIIGTPRFDGGETDEGLLSVYHGGPNGLPGTAAWSYQSNRTLARLGESVSTAGDVNGDGYHDIIAGAPDYFWGQLEEGRAYVFLGSASGLAASPDWITESNEAMAHYGTSVSFAGDVNNDGYHDVLVGAPHIDTSALDGGAIYLYFGSSTGLSTTADWVQTSAHAGAHFGASVSGAGDLDGDGYGDIVAGAPMYDIPDTDEGRVFFYRGTSTIPAYEGGYYRGGSHDSGNHFGQSVAGVGDINGDGYADVVAGAPDDWSSAGGSSSSPGGSFTIFYGNSSGITALGPTYGPGTGHARVGASVATAGDVDGDGLADFVVGAPVAEQVTVYCGVRGGDPLGCGTIQSGQNGSGFGATVNTAGDVNGDGYSDVIVGSPEFTINNFLYGRVYVYHGGPDALVTVREATSGGSLGRLGSSLASADVNGDGFSDLLIGEPEYDGGSFDEGRVFVYHGSRDGLSATPYQLAGNTEGGTFGSAVANAGDVNGDGYDDVVVGVPGYSIGLADRGRAYVYFGSSTGVGLLAPGNMIGGQTNGLYGRAVGAVGDVNGDGFADVAVGAPGESNGQAGEGRVWIYPGTASGPDLGAPWVLEADVAGAEFGRAIAFGDANGDGYSDVLVGAPFDSSVAAEAGRVHLRLGSIGGPAASNAWTGAGSVANEHFGWSVASGDVDGDGLSEVVVGSPGFTGGQSSEGRFHVYSGEPTGALTTMAVRESDIENALFGTAVAVVGDVNGDPYADVFVGGPSVTSFASRGIVRGWYGSPSGITQNASWSMFSLLTRGLFGTAVAGAGDVNGDGFAEVVVGVPNFDRTSTDAHGRFELFLGGGGHGIDRIPRMQEPYGTGDPPVALLGRSPDDDSIRLRSRARSPAGRDRVQVEYEIKPLGVQLDGSNTAFSNLLLSSPPYSDGSRTNFSSRVYGLTQGPSYHWRLRFLSTNPRFPHTRWLWPASIAASQKSFRTNCNDIAWYRDLDGDGYGSPGDTIDHCLQPSGYVAAGGDCDDGNDAVNPGVAESICDAVDNDCSPLSADAPDLDADGFDVCDPTDAGDSDGLLPDCNDGVSETHPGAPESNNGMDDQCPGDEGYGVVDEIESTIGFSDPGDPSLLCWDPQSGAADYEVLRSSDPSFLSACVATVVSAETCFSEPPPAEGETYYYLVRTAAPFVGSWGLDSEGVERIGVCGE